MDDACVRGLVDAWVKREGDKCTPIGFNDVLPQAGRGSALFINATRADMTARARASEAAGEGAR
ncbi:MAG: hypothetical protein JO237_10015 [Pseudolabrys sp.]|nr:hypothetical protein [Pseudolabrys sp.]